MSVFPQKTKKHSATFAHRLSFACHILLGIGVLALGYSGFVFADSHLYQALQAKRFSQGSPLAEPHIPLQDEVIGEIQVPRLKLQAIVVQGDSAASLRRAVGHISTSPLPGEWGNIALAGHRDTFFRPLRNIRVGDEIHFTAAQGSFHYLVDSIQIVAPNDIGVLEPTTGRDLTLVTCFPFYFVGPAPKRFVVHAREVDNTEHEQTEKADGVIQQSPN